MGTMSGQRSLPDRFDIILYDYRSHGWNPVWNRQTHTFPTMVGDSQRIVHAIDDHFGAKPLTGVFHSSAELVALLHQLENESGFAAQLLFEPPYVLQVARPKTIWRLDSHWLSGRDNGR